MRNVQQNIRKMGTKVHQMGVNLPKGVTCPFWAYENSMDR